MREDSQFESKNLVTNFMIIGSDWELGNYFLLKDKMTKPITTSTKWNNDPILDCKGCLTTSGRAGCGVHGSHLFKLGPFSNSLDEPFRGYECSNCHAWLTHGQKHYCTTTGILDEKSAITRLVERWS